MNYTGGLYSADLFLKHVVPEIERSPAFKDGGLIDITFDEGYPPFTYTGNSFANSTLVRAERGDVDRGRARPPRPCSAAACTSSRPGRTRRWPRTLTATSCTPAPALTRTSIARATAFSRRSRACRQGPASSAAAARPRAAHRRRGDAPAGARRSPTTRRSRPTQDARSPAPASRRARSSARSPTRRSTRPLRTRAAASSDTGSFTLVDASGRLLRTTAAVSGVVLGAQTPASDPLYDATGRDDRRWRHRQRADQPLHPPAYHSTVFYNHYSWLRTIEDLFNVGRVPKAWTVRVTSATPPSPDSRRSARTCSPTQTATVATTAVGGTGGGLCLPPQSGRSLWSRLSESGGAGAQARREDGYFSAREPGFGLGSRAVLAAAVAAVVVAIGIAGGLHLGQHHPPAASAARYGGLPELAAEGDDPGQPSGDRNRRASSPRYRGRHCQSPGGPRHGHDYRCRTGGA